MIQTIACVLVAMYGASGNRLLLQQTNPFNPNPVNPGAPIVPAVPVTPSPVFVATLPPLPLPGQNPGGLIPLPEMNCVVPYGLTGSCAASPHTVANPANRFKLGCEAYGACYGSTFTIDIPQTAPGMPTHDGIEFVSFTEAYAGYYATVNINNPSACNGGNNIQLHELSCDTTGACAGLTVNTLGVDIGDVRCEPIDACMGCTVVQESCNPMEPPVTTLCIDLA